jgi:stress response protein YsnF
MNNQTIIAIYHSNADTDRTREDLLAAGLSASDVQIGSAETSRRPSDLTPTAQDMKPREEGFWSWLFGSDIPEAEARRYQAHVYDAGRTLLSVRSSGDLAVDRIVEILERHDPLELDEDSDVVVGDTSAPLGDTAEGAARNQFSAEKVIPTAREELQVGKREVVGTKRFRVRSYTTVRPVEAQVTLRDETVVIERRMPSSDPLAGEGAFQEKEIEVTERREEPVVGKVVRPGEDVVIRRDVKDRVATVRDTVRETTVDVDRAAAGDKPSTATDNSSVPASESFPEKAPPEGKPIP